MKVTGKLLGVREFNIKSKLLASEVRIKGKQAMERAANIIVSRAKEIIIEKEHVITGNLLRSIQAKVGWASLSELIGVIGTDVPYAPRVEALPDGGYLRLALVEKGVVAVTYLKGQLTSIIGGLK